MMTPVSFPKSSLLGVLHLPRVQFICHTLLGEILLQFLSLSPWHLGLGKCICKLEVLAVRQVLTESFHILFT